MKRIVRMAAAGIVLATALMAGSALAGAMAPQQQILFGDSSFSPAKPPAIDVHPGVSEVAWDRADTTLPHNVHQDKRLFRSGAPSAGLNQYRTDIAAGKYHYYCQVHGSKAGGMDGVIKVRPSVAAPSGDSILIRWADSGAEPKHRYRVEFRRAGANRWKVWKKGTAQIQDLFGEGGDPVTTSPTREYQLRVRTFVQGNKKRRSGWSPRLRFSVNP